jgi:hypothetical protein
MDAEEELVDYGYKEGQSPRSIFLTRQEPVAI